MNTNTTYQVRIKHGHAPKGMHYSALYNINAETATSYLIGNTWIMKHNCIPIQITKPEPITQAQKEQYIGSLADECEKWQDELTETKAYIDKLKDICQLTASTGSKEIMQAVLKAIAHGEI